MNTARTAAQEWRKHWYGMLVACLCCLLVGTGLALIVGRTLPTYWIVFGGNTDPGDGHGGGAARGQFVAGGWTDNDHIFQVTWGADITKDTTAEANAAMAAGHAAFNEHCSGANSCVIAGFSLGNAPAIQLASETGTTTNLYMFGAPQPSTGIFHNPYVHTPFVQFWTDEVGGLSQNRPVPRGSSAFYDTRDPYANGGPQCGGPGWFAITLDGHYIINKGQSEQHVWTGPDGVIMHEANYVAQPGVPVSGSDPEPFWSFCPPNMQPPQIPFVPDNMPPVPGVPTG
jgi:hypothetical protein